MPGLKDKMEDYQKVVNYSMNYILDDDVEVSFTFEKNAFPHLVGLHKLVDLPLIQKFNDPREKMVNAKYIMSKIRQGKLTEADIKQSVYFEEINERYERLTAENIFTLTYTDVVVDFNVKLLKKSKLVNTKYILFEKEDNAYRQLCIKQNNINNLYYVETFFYEKSDDYIRGQMHQKVKCIKVIAPDGTIYLEDNFIKAEEAC